MLQSGYSGYVCDLLSALCKYDLRKGALFVLSWARVRRVTQDRSCYFYVVVLPLGPELW